MAVDTIARALALKAEGGNTPPDLSNYVQFSDFATQDKAGVINSGSNGFSVDVSGNTSADVYTSEQYSGLGDNSFISKGTLENIKDDYVGSSTPVKNLNTSLIGITPENDIEGTDNVFDDGLESPLYALGGDGKSEQKTTTGKNKFDTSSLINRTQTIGAATGNIYTLKPNTQYTISTNIVSSNVDGSTPIIGAPQSTNAFIFVSSDTTIETISSNTNGVGTINNISRTLMTDDTGNIFVGIREAVSSSLSNLISEGGYVQIEEGSIATDYEPYTGGQPSPSPDYPQEINSIEGSLEFACNDNKGSSNQVTFDLGEEKLRSVGDVKDELVVDLDTGDYFKVENINEYIYTGNENIDEISNNRFQINIANVGQGVARDGYNNTISMDSHFKSVPLRELSQNINSYSISQQNSYFRIDENTTLEEIKTILQGNNVVVNYQLQTPTTKKLGTLSSEDLAKLKTFKGYNNVTVNTNIGLMNIRFTYGLDIKKYVDNKIAELSAQLIKGE